MPIIKHHPYFNLSTSYFFRSKTGKDIQNDLKNIEMLGIHIFHMKLPPRMIIKTRHLSGSLDIHFIDLET